MIFYDKVTAIFPKFSIYKTYCINIDKARFGRTNREKNLWFVNHNYDI